MTKLSMLRKQLEKEAGFAFPLLLGAGGATAWFNKEKIKHLLGKFGIGYDTLGDFDQGARYANPQIAELAQKIISQGTKGT